MPTTRRIWLIADPHIGHVSDGRDGGDWLAMAMADRRDNIGPVDYAINLGDVAHGYQPEQFARYVQLRDSSGIGRWIDLVGNHDFHGTETGDYQRIVSPHKYWTLTDGNVAFFSLPAERGNAAGLLVPEVEAWLRQQIAAHAGKNIVMAAHQFPSFTVQHSERPARGLYPRDVVEKFLRDMPVALWLGGHIHMAARTPAWSMTRDGVTFINVASASHTYNKDAANSVLLELTEVSTEVIARCRDHDRHRWLDEHEVRITFRFPCWFSADAPTFTPFALNVPGCYAKIEEEQVTGF